MTHEQMLKLQKIMNHYGIENQLKKLMEEARELVEACENVKRDGGDLEGLVDEIADVEVMLWQIKYAFSLFGQVADRKEYKINRQIGRMADDGKAD